MKYALGALIIAAMEADPKFIELHTARDIADINHGASARRLWAHFSAGDVDAYLAEFHEFEKLRYINHEAHNAFHDWIRMYLQQAKSSNA